MAKKEANSFVLTIAGIAAATVIGVVGVKLTPAPHVIFSLAPSAEPQVTAEPEPIGCVLAGTGQVVDFADPPPPAVARCSLLSATEWNRFCCQL